VYTYGIRISKIDEETKNGLRGAVFTLSKNGETVVFAGENGNYHVAAEGENGTDKVMSGENGLLLLKGLDTGEYVLKETKAPDGYVKLQNSINISIGDENLDGKAENGKTEYADGYVPVTVENDKGFTLPVTGGIGTTLFNVAGLSLMGCGVLMLLVFFVKKVEADNETM